MWDFVGHGVYWLFAGLGLLLLFVSGFLVVSKGTLGRRQGLQSALIMLGLGCLITVFIKYDWVAAIVTLVAMFLASVIGGQLQMGWSERSTGVMHPDRSPEDRKAVFQAAFRHAKEELDYDDYNAHLYASDKAGGYFAPEDRP